MVEKRFIIFVLYGPIVQRIEQWFSKPLIQVRFLVGLLNKNNMRYTVRYYNGVDIINDLSTNDESVAVQREIELKKQNPNFNVWICDILLELMVG